MKKKAPAKPRPCPDCPPPKPPKKHVNYQMADAFFGIFGLKRVSPIKKP